MRKPTWRTTWIHCTFTHSLSVVLTSMEVLGYKIKYNEHKQIETEKNSSRLTCEMIM